MTVLVVLPIVPRSSAVAMELPAESTGGATTGVALSDNQFPAFLAATGDLKDVKTNGDLVLHGAFAGVTFRW